MTTRECFMATVNHRRPERLLYGMSFTPDLRRRVAAAIGLAEEADLGAHFGAFGWRCTSLKRPENYPLPDYTPYFEGVIRPEGSYIDAIGCLHVPGSEHHFTHYVSPLRHAAAFSELESFPWTDWSRYQDGHMRAHMTEWQAKGEVTAVSCTHMYEESWQVRGYEEFLVDMLIQPDWAHFILDHFKRRNLRAAIAAATAGADVLISGDDVANQNSMMFSLEVWREFIRDKWAEVYAAAKAIKPDIKVWYHSDGNITAIIPELIEIGVDIFNPLQPECVDLAAIKKRYGNRIVIDGTIGTQTTMPFGTPDDVRACVRDRVNALGQDGALILSPTHVLEPEVPIANILAFAEACREYGKMAL